MILGQSHLPPIDYKPRYIIVNPPYAAGIDKFLAESEDLANWNYKNISFARLFANSEYLLFVGRGLASATKFRRFQTLDNLNYCLQKYNWLEKYGRDNITLFDGEHAQEIIQSNIRAAIQDLSEHKELAEEIGCWQEDCFSSEKPYFSYSFSQLLKSAIAQDTDFTTLWLGSKPEKFSLRMQKYLDIYRLEIKSNLICFWRSQEIRVQLLPSIFGDKNDQIYSQLIDFISVLIIEAERMHKGQKLAYPKLPVYNGLI